MMVIRQPAELAGAPRRVCIAIGVFDGVHLGHQHVIRQTMADAGHHEAASVVVTFDRHPSQTVAPQAVPPAIYSIEQKLSTIAELGVDATLVIRFDEEFSRRTAVEFVAGLRQGFGEIRSICVGSRFTFGHRRQGNVALLDDLGRQHGFQVHGLAAVSLDGRVVSSTLIREQVQAGDLEGAGQMLGREYSLRASVIRGDQFGRTLGFPTANLDVRGLLTPPGGVYAVHVLWGGQRLRGVANIGVRPTVEPVGRERRVEVHVLDFKEDLYGQPLEIQFLCRLRDEMRFGSREALQHQIAADIEAARKLF